MNYGRIILFGYGKFGYSIANNLVEQGAELILVVMNESEYQTSLKEPRFKRSFLMDITDDAKLKTLPIEPDDQLVCLMDDDHLNVFLVLSLTALFPSNRVLALSDSIHATRKLKMAGANQVIDLYSISANRIYNILNKPIATHFLEGFLDSKHEYSFREIEIPQGSFLHEKSLDMVDFRHYGIIFIGMIDIELGNSFIFATTGLEHKLDSGDIIVCIGKDEDLDQFEEVINQSKEPKE